MGGWCWREGGSVLMRIESSVRNMGKVVVMFVYVGCCTGCHNKQLCLFSSVIFGFLSTNLTFISPSPCP